MTNYATVQHGEKKLKIFIFKQDFFSKITSCNTSKLDYKLLCRISSLEVHKFFINTTKAY